jgi:hypothetical protein
LSSVRPKQLLELDFERTRSFEVGDARAVWPIPWRFQHDGGARRHRGEIGVAVGRGLLRPVSPFGQQASKDHHVNQPMTGT